MDGGWVPRRANPRTERLKYFPGKEGGAPAHTWGCYWTQRIRLTLGRVHTKQIRLLEFIPWLLPVFSVALSPGEMHVKFSKTIIAARINKRSAKYTKVCISVELEGK